MDIVEILLAGGNETTTQALGSGMQLLAEHPAEQSRIRESDAWLKTFVEEVLRLGAPLARQDLKSAFHFLLDRLENIRMAPGKPAPVHHHNFMVRGLRHLQVSFGKR